MNQPEKLSEDELLAMVLNGTIQAANMDKKALVVAIKQLLERIESDKEKAQSELLEVLEREVKKEYTVHKDTKSTGSCHVQCHKITENIAREFFLSLLSQHKK